MIPHCVGLRRDKIICTHTVVIFVHADNSKSIEIKFVFKQMNMHIYATKGGLKLVSIQQT